MAIRSGDPMMLEVFANEMNFHAMTGSRIITMDYDDFMEEYMKEDGSGYHTEQRQMGKLANLSCNYRISGEALARQAYTKYDTYIDKSTGRHLVSTFNRAYPGVEQYWKDVINESMQRGYTEEFGGRRFKLSEWSSNRWATESSALMFPIQGAGASMKEIAIKELFSKEPNFHFALDLHDASFGFIRDDIAEDVRKNLDDILNTIDYEKYWGFKTPIKLPYESKMGETFKDVK
jgi:DNA polymerase I-like protein with 3'-5' exonuclease and polymerase domains